MNEREEFWSGQFGNDYTARNRVNWRSRVPFWREVMDLTGARSVFEVGCNAGWNLSAIQTANPLAMRYGCEINETAADQAIAAGHGSVILGSALEVLDSPEPTFDLVFTAGVLIHVGPDDLEATMRAIAGASADYVLAVEYAADQEEEVEYRGHTGKLWRRPFGKLYESMGLQMVCEWKPMPAFDNATAWLMVKP